MIFFNNINKKKKYENILFDEKNISAIQNLLVDVSTLQELSVILQRAVDSAVKVLKLHGGILFLLSDDKKYIYTKTMAKSYYSDQALKLLKIDNMLDQLKVSLKENDNLVVRSIINDEIITSDTLSEFTIGVLDSNLVNIIQKATMTGNAVVVPVKYQDNTIGALMLTKRDKNTDFSLELPIIQIYSIQIGIAIVNAKLFTERQHQLELLEQKNKELQTLFELTRNVSKSLNSDVIKQNAVNSLPQDQEFIGAILSAYDPESGDIIVQNVSQNEISKLSEKLLGDFKKYTLNTKNPRLQEHPTVRAILENRPMEVDDLESLFVPPIPKGLFKPFAKILSARSAIVYPLNTSQGISGVLIFVLKDKSIADVSISTKALLSNLSTQIGIALENSRLFENSETIQNSLKTALEQLEQARKRERDIIDIMGHELRTPMSIVRNALGMMHLFIKTKGEIPAESQKKYVEIAMESANREVNLIETMLSATKADAKGFQLTFEKVSLKKILDNSLLAFTHEAHKKDLELSIDVNGGDVLVYADALRIQEVVDNFVSNAIKYTFEGFVKIKIEKQGDYGLVQIIDSGEGISEEDLKHLGEKFFRAKQHAENSDKQVIRPGGTGLGLYVSFSLIKLMDGEIIVESEHGKGSVFGFKIPLYNEQETKQVLRKNNEDEAFFS